MTLIDQLQDELCKLGDQPDQMIGCSPAEIQELKSIQGVSKLPGLYEEFLSKMGRNAGSFFRGSWFPYEAMIYTNFKQDAVDYLKEQNVSFKLPDDVFVFLWHQGYIFLYFNTEASEWDPIIYRYSDGDAAPKEIGHLSKLFLSELELHKKLNKASKA